MMDALLWDYFCLEISLGKYAHGIIPLDSLPMHFGEFHGSHGALDDFGVSVQIIVPNVLVL